VVVPGFTVPGCALQVVEVAPFSSAVLMKVAHQRNRLVERIRLHFDRVGNTVLVDK
jgi:hypothetical protein